MARDSLVSDIPAGGQEKLKPFLQCTLVLMGAGTSIIHAAIFPNFLPVTLMGFNFAVFPRHSLTPLPPPPSPHHPPIKQVKGGRGRGREGG
jgi:hypothetical protein